MRPVNGETDHVCEWGDRWQTREDQAWTSTLAAICKHRNVARVTSHLGYQTLFLVCFFAFLSFFCLFVFSLDTTLIKCLKGLEPQKSFFLSSSQWVSQWPRVGTELPGQLQISRSAQKYFFRNWWTCQEMSLQYMKLISRLLHCNVVTLKIKLSWF